MIKDIENDIGKYIEESKKDFEEISLQIWNKPEVSNYEFFACKTLSEKLEQEGFRIENNAAGHRTAFAAYKKSKKSGPVIVFLAEYDALAGLGHGCGHNIIGCTSALAAVALSKVIDRIGGEVRVYGTPGEEGGEQGSSKESFVREGYFKDVDAALIAHPGIRNAVTQPAFANDPVDIEFWGKPAHAAAAPENGINALDAIIMVYNAVNALRQHVPSDVRMHGVITNGGVAANIVPEYASARFYLRAMSRRTLDDVYKKVERIVEGAALCTGAKGKMARFQNKVDNMVITPSFDMVYRKRLESLGQVFEDVYCSLGSTDVGNVSYVVPTIQPIIKITDVDCAAHTEQFKQECSKPYAISTCALCGKALALTALDLMTNKELLAKIKDEHKLQVEKVK